MSDGNPLRSYVHQDGALISRIVDELPTTIVDPLARERLALIGVDVVRATGDDEALLEVADALGDVHHLNPAAAHPLRVLAIPEDAAVLQIGAGWGTISSYLGKRVGTLDVVERDASDAWLAGQRTRELEPVMVFVGSVADIPSDAVYDLVVVAAPEQADLDADDTSAPIAGLDRLVRPGGTLVVIAANPLGVKRLAGGSDAVDATPISPFVPPAPPVAINPQPIVDELGRSGYATRSAAIFPDQWSPRVVMDIDGLLESAPQLVTALPVFPSPDAVGAVPRAADESVLWSDSVAAGLGVKAANAFMIVATRHAARMPWAETLLATYWSSGRRSSQSAQNSVVVTDARLWVERRRLHRSSPAPTGTVRFVEGTEPFVRGEGLVDRIATASDLAGVGALLALWTERVAAQEESASRVLWDYVPHNLIVTDTGVEAIDQEWLLADGDWDTVRRRGVFWLASRIAERKVRPEWSVGSTVAAVAAQLGALIGLDSDGDWLGRFYVEEAAAVVDVWRPDPRVTRNERIPQFAGLLESVGNTPWEQIAAPALLADRYRQLEQQLTGSTTMDNGYVSMAQSVESLKSELAARDGELAARDAEVAAKQAEIVALEKQLESMRLEARHTALLHRDHTMGLEAELVTARSQSANLRGRLDRANTLAQRRLERSERLAKTLAETRKVARERAMRIDEMRASTTWRVGRFFVKPFSIFSSSSKR
jgi:hypothetical protein